MLSLFDWIIPIRTIIQFREEITFKKNVCYHVIKATCNCVGFHSTLNLTFVFMLSFLPLKTLSLSKVGKIDVK